ncbi:site-specific DNA-methyltransferase [Nakamurella silvestris]|nr:site-specific DNA-methyltransferase [Nakamurella silvestris]
MRPSYYADDSVTLHHGQAVEVLSKLKASSVDCCVTSPPYFGLRDYGVDGQIGAEESPAEFITNLVAVFREARRVLADDGTCWVNLGDSFASSASWGRGGSSQLEGRKHDAAQMSRPSPERSFGVPPKNLLGMPWRVAFAMQDDGWILRNAIVWHKPNAMPESVTDRLSTRYEMVFMFTKFRRYGFDLDPIRQGHTMKPQRRPAGRPVDAIPGGIGQPRQSWSTAAREDLGVDGHPLGKNPGDVWEIATTPFPGAHFAVFPPELPRRCILAGCKPGGTVLDPFSGSGTTGMVALQNGRKYIGIDLNREYLDLSLRTRLSNGVLDFAGEA